MQVLVWPLRQITVGLARLHCGIADTPLRLIGKCDLNSQLQICRKLSRGAEKMD